MKVVIGGHLNQEENEVLVRDAAPDVEVEVTDDMSAAMAVQTGDSDYYLGSCQTGAGGALAMPIALLGGSKCVSIAGPGFTMPDDEIRENVNAGKVAFGFVPEAAETVIPVLMAALLEKGDA